MIKMSSTLFNVSNDAGSMPEEFSLKDTEVPVDNEEENWLKRSHVERFLGIEDIWASLNDLENCEMLTRQELIPTRHGTLGWSRPKDQQNKTDKFVLVYGVMYVIVNSRNNKGKALKEYMQESKRSKKNKPSQSVTIKYKSLSLEMRSINRKF